MIFRYILEAVGITGVSIFVYRSLTAFGWAPNNVNGCTFVISLTLGSAAILNELYELGYL